MFRNVEVNIPDSVRAERLRRAFCIPRSKVMSSIRDILPDFTEADLDALEAQNRIFVRAFDGEKRYLRSFLDTLAKDDPAFRAPQERNAAPKPDEEKDCIRALMASGEQTCSIHVRTELRLDAAAFVANAPLRVDLPIPRRCAQQSGISVQADGATIAEETALQRTACFRRRASENLPFSTEYSYTSTIRYINAYENIPCPSRPYPDAAPVCADDLAPLPPHIVFAPELTEAARIAQAAEGNLDKARILYDFLTRNIRYSFMPDYLLLEDQALNCLKQKRGDCGIMALLFLTLCRISGIPARWQSGLVLRGRAAYCHDWAQFYTEEYGWLFCDLSSGAHAHAEGDEALRRFWFGNIDPMRMVANGRYQTDFALPKTALRHDPYDNQTGEVEVNGETVFPEHFDSRTEVLAMSCTAGDAKR